MTQMYIRSDMGLTDVCATAPSQAAPLFDGALSLTSESKLEVLTPPPSARLPLGQAANAVLRWFCGISVPGETTYSQPLIPLGPRVPAGPAGPTGPLEPFAPVAPFGPAGPCAPWSPLSPFGPTGPPTPTDGGNLPFAA